MSAVLFAIEPLLERLKDGRLFITANNRQRNQILRAYHDFQHRQGGQVSWPEPQVYALNQWLEHQWNRYLFTPQAQPKVIINRWQTSLIWEQVISDQLGAQQLLQASQLAAKAEAARVALQAWRCPIQEVASWPAAQEPFSQWYDAFHGRLNALDLITSEDAQEQLIIALNNGQLPQTYNASIYGFDDIPPLIEVLLETALPDAQIIDDATSEGLLSVTSEADSEHEIRRAALWADEILDKNPKAVIGIIVPELGRQRDQVERIFSEVFTPLSPLPNQPRQVAPFNFSTGTPLGRTPIINSALELITFHCRPCQTDLAVSVLDSIFWGEYEAEKLLRTKAIATLRSRAKYQLKSSEIRKLCRELIERSGSEAGFAKRLEVTQDVERQAHFKLNLGEWVEKISSLLAQLGWPGERRLDSVEYQQVSLWNDTLIELSQLSRVQTPLTLGDTLNLLKKQLDRTPFQPQTPDSPIQVLGLLEASGLNFTHAWVMGMHHQAWPPAASPNPLLPIGLQREWKMPRASAERELVYAEQLTQRLRHCAPMVIFSYPRAEGDRQLLPSALIQDIPKLDTPLLTENSQTLSQINYHKVAASQALEWVDCEFGPPLLLNSLPGGSGIFTAQARCPFAAFANYRLGAYQIEAPRFGFSAAERGNILHSILANFWQEIQTQSALLASSAEALSQRVNKLAQEAVANASRKRPELTAALIALESERLSQQILEWLELEKQRPDFTVHWLEEKVSAQFAGLEFDVRLDRVDTLSSGERLVIDYKTGSSSTSGWKETRFTDPQLPLYACALGNLNIAAIALVSISAKATELSGWGDEATQVIEGIGPPEAGSWPQQLDTWQEKLQELASELQQGYASTTYRSLDAKRYDSWLEPLSRTNENAQLQRWLSQNEGTL
ncbi:PD-(D/E)XK nuclease family protein [Gilvimarinus chinensis]|uniref:PD-(D/E)XK nuclease family protein n=1 Tax=Gilvimarinus chinensis TaxID=396005 RepID=UPI00037025FB|nr:PD-(D/E)XK nuclease family protein [Gilvimarinus chinensis]